MFMGILSFILVPILTFLFFRWLLSPKIKNLQTPQNYLQIQHRVVTQRKEEENFTIWMCAIGGFLFPFAFLILLASAY